MCGRFTRKSKPKAIADLFSLPVVPEILTPRYNIAPTERVAVVANKNDEKTRALGFVKWGLIPSWVNDPKEASPLFNARAETVHELSSFREPFRKQRCLIVADGFYEWLKTGPKRSDPRIPHYFRMKDESPFAFAGLWDVFEAESKLVTCTVVTITPNSVVEPVHNRMPVILKPQDYTSWLSHDTSVAELLGMLKPYSAEEMEGYVVGSAVSRRIDSFECIAPAKEHVTPTLL